MVYSTKDAGFGSVNDSESLLELSRTLTIETSKEWKSWQKIYHDLNIDNEIKATKERKEKVGYRGESLHSYSSER